jgi:hypothetical protein
LTDRARRPVRMMTAGAVALCGILLPLGQPTGPDAAEDYPAIFGDRYAEAENYLRENPWIAEGLRLSPEETRLALAVVFPEVIRYSYLQDKIQVRALKVLYVQYGRKYANFSIGRFQMKPSFIEQLESDWNRLARAEERAAVRISAFDILDEPGPRQERIVRLEAMRWQVDYLRLFMAVMRKRYGAVVFKNVEDRLRFYATAYNSGYAAGEEKLRRRMEERHFHLELFSPKRTYNYADVAVFFFRHLGL